MSELRVTTVEDTLDGGSVSDVRILSFDGTPSDTGGGGGGAVDSVNGETGVVVLSAADVGAQPADSDLTAIAALTTTVFGRGLLALVDAAALRTAAGLGTAATQASTAFDPAGAATTAQAAAQAASQPLDSDLTAIAALATTTYGRSLLTAADAAAARALTGAGTSNLALGTTSSTAKAGDYQPAAANISDASAIGRSVLTAADAAAVRAAIGAGTSSLALGTTGATAAAGNDSRLSDSRTPTAHAASHAAAGSDPLTLAESQVTGLVTDLAGKAASVHTHAEADVTGLVADLAAKVPTTRTVAGHALSADVTLVKGDVGLGNVDNTADSAKTFTESQVTGLVADLAAKAPLASPTFTGTPAAPTVAGTSDSTTKISTTAFVQAVAALLAPLASPALTGNPTAPTPTAGDNDTSIATTAFVTTAVAAGGGGSAWTKVVDLPLTTLTGWTAGAGTWGASGSGIAQSGAGTGNRLFYNTLLDQAEMVVQVEIRIDTMSAGGHAGVVFGAPATDATTGFEVSLLGSTSQTTSLYAEVDGVAAVSTVALAANINHSTFITVKFHKSGNTVTGWVNGTLVTGFAAGGLSGTAMRLAFKTANATATIRNLVVYTPTLPI